MPTEFKSLDGMPRGFAPVPAVPRTLQNAVRAAAGVGALSVMWRMGFKANGGQTRLDPMGLEIVVLGGGQTLPGKGELAFQ